MLHTRLIVNHNILVVLCEILEIALQHGINRAITTWTLGTPHGKHIDLFEYLFRRLSELKGEIRPIDAKVVYQRPCSNRLVPETQHWVDDIFGLIGADRAEREYDRENALCCGTTIRAAQRDDLADDVQNRNLDDMEAVGAKYCVFNCPACFFTMKGMAAERGMTPILLSDLCQIALGE